MGYGRRYFHHTLFATATAVVNGVVLYILRAWVLYPSLSYEDYGLFYAVLSFSFLVYPFLTFGFDYGIVPYITRCREQDDPGRIKNAVLGCLALQLVTAAVLGGAVILFAEPIAVRCFGSPQTATLVRIIVVFTGLLLLWRSGAGILLGLQCIATRHLADLTRTVVCLVSVALLIRRGYGIEAAGTGYLVSVVAAILTQTAGLAILYPRVVRARFQWDAGSVLEIFRSGKYLAVAFGGILIFSHMDTAMLILVRGDLRAVAAYQVAVPTMMIIYALLSAGASNFMPMAATLWHRGERDLLADGLERINEAATVVVVPATVLVACFCDVLMETLFPRDILDAPVAFVILAAGSVFFFTCLFNLHVLSGIDRARNAGTCIAFALVVNLVLNLVLIYWLGIAGAALATVLSHAVATVLSLAAIRKSLNVRYRVGTAVATLAGCVLLGGVCGLVRTTAMFAHHQVTVAAAVCVILYPAWLAVVEALGYARLRELVSVMVRGRPR